MTFSSSVLAEGSRKRLLSVEIIVTVTNAILH